MVSAIEAAPGEAGALYRGALALAQRGRGPEALDAARRAASAARDPRTLLDLASLVDLLGETQEARGLLRRAAALGPEQVEPQVRLARHLVAHGELRAASLAARAGLDRHPSHAPLHAVLAEALIGLAELGSAARALSDAEHFGIADHVRHRLLARHAERSGDFDKALDALAHLEPLEPSDVPLVASIARGLANGGHRARAQALVERALDHALESVSARVTLAELALSLGLAARALGVGRALLAAAPDRADVHAIVGEALVALGALEDGVAELRAAIRIGGVSRSLWRTLGRALLELGRVDDAIEVLTQALSSGASDEDTREALWLALSRASRRTQAVRPSRPPERVSMWADLAVVAVPELLQLLGTQQTSGLLWFEGQRGPARLELASGELVGARWPGAPTLREVLIEQGLVGEVELRGLSEPIETDLALCRALLDARLVEPQRLADLVGARVVAAVAELVRWTDGEVSLTRIADAALPRVPFRLDARWVLLEAARHADEGVAR
jgi:tetratricopeptide (TPR) repeat protein